MKLVISSIQGLALTDVESGFVNGSILLSFHENIVDNNLMNDNILQEFLKRNPTFDGALCHLVFKLTEEIILSAFDELLEKWVDDCIAKTFVDPIIGETLD